MSIFFGLKSATFSGDFNGNKMANLLDSVENSVWHAFEYMALEGDGTVPKSKLKVGSETKSGSSYFPS